MRFSEVSKDDMLMLATLSRMLHAATYPNIAGKDITASATALAWFNNHCQTVAKSYGKDQGVVEVPPPPAPAAGGLPAGIKIKSMGKAKK